MTWIYEALISSAYRRTLFEKANFVQKFSGNQSCQPLKSANLQHFHDFSTQNFFDNFSWEIKVEFLDKK